MADIELPEPDRIDGAPHPRETRRLFGQEAAEAAFLAAFAQGRLHHAWMLSGPKGIGKATLAWRMAHYLLEHAPENGAQESPALFAPPPPPDHLDGDPDSALSRRLRALSEPRLHLLRRTPNDKGLALSQFITVDDVRAMKDFFMLSAADGGARVAIVDCLDEMNPNAANAFLKLLEEPPARSYFLLVSHQPARLLPTIRSRCRELRLSTLSPEALAQALAQAGGEIDAARLGPLAELSGGSVGDAFQLTHMEGLENYAGLVRLLNGLPRLDRARALQLCETAAQRGAEAKFDLMLAQIDQFLTRLARAAVRREAPPEAAPGETALFARLAPSSASARPWAELAQSLTQRARRGRAVNLDPAALLMDILLRIDAAAGQIAAE